MKVLFLDIDGVLNGHEKHEDSPYTTIRPDCILRLNKILKATQTKLVISSSWRYMMLSKRPAMTLLGFQYMLHTHGIAEDSSIIGYTCSDEEISDRGKQILNWVAVHNIITWAVVDDMYVDLGVEYYKKLVRTDGKRGLEEQDVVKLIQLLG